MQYQSAPDVVLTDTLITRDLASGCYNASLWATINRRYLMLDPMLSSGYDIDNPGCKSAVVAATKMRDAVILEKLLSAGILPVLAALKEAFKNRDEICANILIAQLPTSDLENAVLNIGGDPKTCLQVALHMRMLSTIRALIEQGVDRNSHVLNKEFGIMYRSLWTPWLNMGSRAIKTFGSWSTMA
jgi:hypothetical protein